MRKYHLGLGDIPLNVDSGLAPGVGAGTALATAALLKAYASPSSTWYRNAGWWGAAAAVLGSGLYGLARGMGAGVVSGISGVGVGAGYELVQKAVNYGLTRTVTPPAAPSTPAVDGLGYVRARALRGLGAPPRGFLPAIGSSPLDVMQMAGVQVR